jgi:hypothetical protein
MEKSVVFIDRILRIIKNDNDDWWVTGEGMFGSKEAKEIADAIYKELGLGWLPYPENRPETDDDYYWDKDGYYLCAIQNFDDPGEVFEFEGVLWFDDERMKWVSPDGVYFPLPHLRVLKFRKIPD